MSFTNSRDFSHKSSSKTKKIQCRVESCKKFIIEQGYKRHLSTVHPKEDSRDLRGYGVKPFPWRRQPVLGNADLELPSLVDVPPDEDGGGKEVTGKEDDDDDRTRVRDRSWDRDQSEDEEVRLEGRKEREILMR